jgi:peptidyl-prolyl cis-trans isomerase SurA
MSRLLKEAYQRHLQQVKARHISIRVPRGAPAADTAQAYRQLRKIRKKAKQGTGFESLAQAYQEQVNAGSLGYFSVFDQPYPVENTAYSLSPGSVSKPLRTDFGYHLIKVTDKRPYSGKMRAKHIMIKPEQKGGSDNQQSAQNQIDSLYQRIQEGADFSRIARRHSEDRRSSRKGGKLPLFDRTNPNFPSKFKRRAFALKENGAITEPFKTQYGYHLLKRVKMKAPDSFTAMKPGLKEKLKKDKRYERVEASVTDRIKRQSGYKRMLPEFGPLPQQLDSTFKTGGWTIKDPEPLRTPLFRIGDTTYQLLAFARYLEEQSGQKLGQFKYRSYALEALYEDFERERIKAYERRHLAAKHPEYRHLLKEYKEGVLLFEIMDRKVWSKAVEDSTGLRALPFSLAKRAAAGLYQA